MQAIAFRLQAIAIRLQAIAIRLQAIAIRLQALAFRLQAIAIRLVNSFFYANGSFSRMRSEGFSFNSGGLGVESCSRSVVSMFATVRNRSQPSATVRSRTLRRCHWGKLLQVTFHGCVTCQFATLFHCDLHENDMSRKKRDGFRCTGAVV